MKHIFITILCVAAFVFSCKTVSSQEIISTVLVTEFDALLKADTTTQQLIDARTPQEFNSGHLPHANNFNVNSAGFAKQIADLDKDKPVYVYCKSGARSAKAAKLMQDAGFKKVYNLDGGIAAWEAKHLAVEK